MTWAVEGKRVLVTGGTSGIGNATAEALSRLGADVTITARNASNAEINAEDLTRRTGRRVTGRPLDLASLRSVRAFADRFHDEHDGLDVLVNNAGTMTRRRDVTEDGFERTFAVNHLGPFLLTNLLTDLLDAPPASRVITVSSEAHRSAKAGLDFADLQMVAGHSASRAYAASKVANILFTVELDRRHPSTLARALHPGVVATSFGKGPDGPRWMGIGMTLLKPLLSTPQQGAETSVLLATADDDTVGQSLYWSVGKPATPSDAAADPDAARRLWDVSWRLVGLGS
jgi:NAD(P)-dependent dehydrogenase (short-subunit alcohol dehydrogenase family)